MDTIRLCPQCRQPLSADAPDGLCPQCLMKAASGPPPSAVTEGLPGAVTDIGDPAEIAKKLPQFEILELLGRGGMGVVYKARQLNLDRIVALKILPPMDALSADFVARFTREARSLAKLNHPNIVNVYDFGETGGLYYIVMEYVDGANLRQLYAARKFTPAEALAIVPKICDALQYAHEEGLVHRDIKPENLLIDKKGRVKIADFGLAKLLRREALDMSLTLSGMALGTLRYMAPEQMDKPESVDHRADLYSLGVVIYEMLTGETPVGRFELPSQKAEVDVRLDQIVLHALEREPERRYQHASEVRDDVEKVTSKPMAAPPSAPARHLWRLPKSKEGRRARFILPILGAVLLTLGLIVPARMYAMGGWPLVGFAILMAAVIGVIVTAGFAILHEWLMRRSPLMWKAIRTVLLLVPALCFVSFLNAKAQLSASGVSMTIGIPFPWFELGAGNPGGRILFASWSWPILAAGWLILFAWRESFSLRPDAAGESAAVGSGDLPAKESGPSLGGPALRDAIRTPLFFIVIGIAAVVGASAICWSFYFAERNRPSNPGGWPEAKAPASVINAAKDAPFTNSLGQEFVPVPGTRALFCRWDTRVKDYVAFSQVNGNVDGWWANLSQNGVPISSEPEDPVVNVSWDDAKAFCQWLTKKETAEGRLPKGWEYRLPTDEEWSRAVGLPKENGATPQERNGMNQWHFPWGIGYPPKPKAGNYADSAYHEKFPKEGWMEGYTDGYATTSPVGSFPPNEYGLYDMGGNVWQLCEDLYKPGDANHVVRGSSWYCFAIVNLVSSYRGFYGTADRTTACGFRCVVSVSAR